MTQNKATGSKTMVRCKGAHCSQDIILTGVRWYMAYPLNWT